MISKSSLKTRAKSNHGLLPEWQRIPFAADGNTIGLYGGSFNPPHPGHLHVAQTALKRLNLDQLWWLVTPGNPLKDKDDLASTKERVQAARELIGNPRMKVTALEEAFGETFSARTIQLLQKKRPKLKFVWVMGADNLAEFHCWRDWDGIFNRVPIAIINRPDATLSPLSSPAGIKYAFARVEEKSARHLKQFSAPAWVFLHAPLSNLSSRFLRKTTS